MTGLGLWIEFSAFCFYLVENYAHDRALERDLGLFNSQLESKVAAETAAIFEGQDDGEGQNPQPAGYLRHSNRSRCRAGTIVPGARNQRGCRMTFKERYLALTPQQRKSLLFFHACWPPSPSS